jgi:hypothetical protein
MSRVLADADDDELTRVVAMIDKLAERGAADAVLSPLRPRLARVRPARPTHLTRLLCCSCRSIR